MGGRGADLIRMTVRRRCEHIWEMGKLQVMTPACCYQRNWTNTDLERSGYPHYVDTPMKVSGRAWSFLAASLTNLSFRDALCDLAHIGGDAWMRETVIADSTNYWLNVMLALGLGTDLQMVSVPRSPLTPQIPSYRLQTQKTSSKKKKKEGKKQLRATELLGNALDVFLWTCISPVSRSERLKVLSEGWISSSGCSRAVCHVSLQLEIHCTLLGILRMSWERENSSPDG